MRKFRFRLESLLALRTQERDREAISVSEANQALRILRGRLSDQEELIAREKMKLTDLQGAIVVDDLLARRRYELILLQDKQEIQQQIEQVIEELHRRELLLTTAEHELNRIEKVREFALRKHREEERKQMQSEMDEIASVLYRRSRAGHKGE